MKISKNTLYLAGGAALLIALMMWWSKKKTFNGMTAPVTLSGGKTYSVDSAYNDAGF